MLQFTVSIYQTGKIRHFSRILIIASFTVEGT